MDARLDPTLRAIYAAHAGGDRSLQVAGDPAPGGWVSVAVRGAVSEGALESLGGRLLTRAGLVTTAFVPIDVLPGLLSLPGVESVESGQPLEKHLNVSCTDIDAADVWAGTPPNYNGYTGKNVIIGIVDTGLDLTHSDFRTATGQTRVKALWDQGGVGGPPPAAFNYGVEWTESQINANLSISVDLDGHGTHITGIAAGNGRATGNGFPAFRYVGVAPEADLIVVRSVLTDNSLIDGANFVFQKAAALGKPAVVLVAAGNQRGAHDGTSTLDLALSALTGVGKLIVASAGNNGTQAIHSRLDLPSGGSGNFTFTIPTYAPSTNENLDFQAWHEPNAQFQVRLTTPSGIQSAWIQPGVQTGTVATNDGAYYVNNDIATSSKGSKLVQVYLWYQGGTTPRPKTGTWRVDVQRLSGSTSGLLHAWIAAWRFGSGGVTPAFTTNVDYTMLVASPATGDSILSAGAYTTRNTWTNMMGQTSFYTDYPSIQGLYDVSNAGPRRDGVQRPDVVAPGEGVISALSAPIAGTLGNVKVDDGKHWICRGTSMAAAHVAGAVALFLQQYPNLTPSSARSLLRSRVRTDANTGSVPNSTWGYGKLDLAIESTAVGPVPGSPFALAAAYPNPTRRGASFDFDLSAADLASGGVVTLRLLDVRGREVARVSGSAEPGAQRLTWNGLDSRGLPVSPGVYVGRLEVGAHAAEKKFVKLP